MRSCQVSKLSSATVGAHTRIKITHPAKNGARLATCDAWPAKRSKNPTRPSTSVGIMGTPSLLTLTPPLLPPLTLERLRGADFCTPPASIACVLTTAEQCAWLANPATTCLVGRTVRAYSDLAQAGGSATVSAPAPRPGPHPHQEEDATVALTEPRFGDFATPIRYDADQVIVDVRGELDVATAPSLQ